MSGRYVISIDQSTQGTKALLFDKNGVLMCRCDVAHKQIINDLGWVSHDPEEIYENVITAVKGVISKANISPELVVSVGISNQRETSLIWEKETGKPLNHAVVWQCARAASICERSEIKEIEAYIYKTTGIKLSPYFPAAKIAWLLENTMGAGKLADNNAICHGTMDSYLVYRLTGGQVYATDYSNASRTQLFDIFNLKWDERICSAFGIEVSNMPKVMDSDSCYGYTDFEGLLSEKIPIHGVMGDSHAALFGQDCCEKGKTKATYGTGSSIMMNIGEKPILSKNGLVTSLAWGRGGHVQYVLEGNLNYTGAVITWLKDDLGLIENAAETEKFANEATRDDELYLVPAFTGLGAPYWNFRAKAAIIGMDRTTGKAEFCRAALECIAYQITDIVKAMSEDSGVTLSELRVDGGPTRNEYLMQFQSDMAGCKVLVPNQEELSGIGAAYMAGIAAGLWDDSILSKLKRTVHEPTMDEKKVKSKYEGWKKAVETVNK
ncbi:MAG: glycerol kinase GlpK [Butyrivibrio sp.]|uniref:FGGY-family carbohydrate kinase n=1 Tax=Butyrivibrio sp. TaxID=28121 RepID=UPI001B2CB729|nr:glycerol kinase [Butyrivibrio sp.]MBO6241001.1 glycerol kinase GlpK [Butyrivibrio sp.]